MGKTSDAVSGSALRMWHIGSPNDSGWMEITQHAYYLSHFPAYLHLYPRGAGSTDKFYPGFFFFFELKLLKSLFTKRLPCTPGNGAESERIPLLLLNLNIWIHNMVLGASDWEGKTWVLLSAPHFSKFLVNRPQLQYENNLSPSFLSAISLSFLHAQSISTLTTYPYMVGEECSWPVDLYLFVEEGGWGL